MVLAHIVVLAFLLAILFVVLKIERLVKELFVMADEVPQDILDLQAAVARETTVVQSAATLMNGLSAALLAALKDPNPTAAVEAVVASMNANMDALTASVAANTLPTAPAPTDGGPVTE